MTTSIHFEVIQIHFGHSKMQAHWMWWPAHILRSSPSGSWVCCLFAAHSSMKYGHIPHLIRYDGGDTVRRERKTEITRIEKVWNGIPIGKGSSCRFFVDNFFNTEQISKKSNIMAKQRKKTCWNSFWTQKSWQ